MPAETILGIGRTSKFEVSHRSDHYRKPSIRPKTHAARILLKRMKASLEANTPGFKKRLKSRRYH